jgi:P-type Cu+ transporter
MIMSRWLLPPRREYALIAALLAAFVVDFFYPAAYPALFVLAVLAALPTVSVAWAGLRRKKITIEAFNVFALIIAFISTDARSAGFITLMLSSAQLLDYRTSLRTRRALEELLALRPATATLERGKNLVEVPVGEVKVGDTVIVRAGGRIPVDGMVVFGATHVNESSVTGESMPVPKACGDFAYSGTLVESGVLKLRAELVGKDSTIERMAALMKDAGERKSRPERLADRFAAVFLPAVALLGLIVYGVTRNATMTASLFLVACADDMAVAIPLAVTAALGAAAKRGILVKGGERLEMLAKMKVVVLDKTGTLTYGSLAVERLELLPEVETKDFWAGLASAEKFSEHPVGRAVYRLAASKLEAVADPLAFETVVGGGVVAKTADGSWLAGTAKFLADNKITFSPPEIESGLSAVYLARDGQYLGRVVVSDLPRPEAGEALWNLKKIGVERIVMFTGDNEASAARAAASLGITEYHSAMKPEDKLVALQGLLGAGPVGMVGDGVNDAPALSRADVGIAMGGGAAVSLEAADVVIIKDDLGRLPELVTLSRRLLATIKADSVIWAVSNLFGFALVLTGVAGPALAAFYNFATDFLPLANSSRMFRAVRESKEKYEKNP